MFLCSLTHSAEDYMIFWVVNQRYPYQRESLSWNHPIMNNKKNQNKQIEVLPEVIKRVGPSSFVVQAQLGMKFFLRGNYTIKTQNCSISIDQYQVRALQEVNVVEAELYNQIMVVDDMGQLDPVGQIEIETNKLDFKLEDVQYNYLSESKQQILEEIHGNRIMVMGAKNTGKSTTCLQLCNMLVSQGSPKVYLMDLDIGQPFSWGTPGFISLYEISSATFFQKQSLIYNGFVGEFSTQHYNDIYLEHVQNALKTVPRDEKLIINTHGYVQSFGKVLAQYLVRICEPHNILILSNSQNTAEKAIQLQQSVYQKIMFSLSSLITVQEIQEEAKITLIEEDYMQQFNNINLSQQLNPQGKKSRRERLLLQSLGLINIKPNVSILTQLCLMPIITLQIKDSIFSILPFTLDQPINFDKLVEPLQIAKVFNCSLVSLSIKSTTNPSIHIHSSGIGMIKDFDIDAGTFDMITTLRGSEWIIVKSQHYELGRETLQVNIEEMIELQDLSCIMQSKPINHIYNLPYIYPTSKAIGFKSPKLNINKKIQKQKK